MASQGPHSWAQLENLRMLVCGPCSAPQEWCPRMQADFVLCPGLKAASQRSDNAH